MLEDSSSFFDLPANTLIAGRYRVVERLGTGSMGSVFKVADEHLEGEIIALKYLHPKLIDDPNFFQRFRREVVIARKLAHPNIVKVFELNTDERGNYFFTLEFVEGISLKDKIAQTGADKLKFKHVVRILIDVCEGIHHAHEHGIIHRDLKPANIVVDSSNKIKILDFGLARNDSSTESLTQHGECIGTAPYISPEHIRGKDLDGRADIYAIGMLAYEMIAGHPPFRGDNWFKIAEQHLKRPVPTLKAFGQDVPVWYQQFIEKCTAKKKEDRFRSAQDAARMLKRKITPKKQKLEQIPPEEEEFPLPIPKEGAVLFLKGFLKSAALTGLLGTIVCVVVLVGFPDVAPSWLSSKFERTGQRANWQDEYNVPRIDPTLKEVLNDSIGTTEEYYYEEVPYSSGRRHNGLWKCRKGRKTVFKDQPAPGLDCKPANISSDRFSKVPSEELFD